MNVRRIIVALNIVFWCDVLILKILIYFCSVLSENILLKWRIHVCIFLLHLLLFLVCLASASSKTQAWAYLSMFSPKNWPFLSILSCTCFSHSSFNTLLYFLIYWSVPHLVYFGILQGRNYISLIFISSESNVLNKCLRKK